MKIFAKLVLIFSSLCLFTSAFAFDPRLANFPAGLWTGDYEVYDCSGKLIQSSMPASFNITKVDTTSFLETENTIFVSGTLSNMVVPAGQDPIITEVQNGPIGQQTTMDFYPVSLITNNPSKGSYQLQSPTGYYPDTQKMELMNVPTCNGQSANNANYKLYVTLYAPGYSSHAKIK